MLQLKMKKDTKNYFQRVLNKINKYFIVWHGNCYNSALVINITGFESFSRREGSHKKKNLKIKSGPVSYLTN